MHQDSKIRVLLIGLDSAGLNLVLPWISKGFLPNLAKIFKEGTHGDLISMVPSTPPGWSSIYTGKNPGKHGIYGFTRTRANSYAQVSVNSTMRDGMDIWDILSNHGKKVAVVNAPVTYPPHKLNGIMVTGFMTPKEDCVYTSPPSLKEELRKACPEYRVHGSDPSPVMGRSVYLRELHRALDARGKAMQYLMGKIDWDFFFIAFSETDHVQHMFWEYIDEMSARATTDEKRQFGNAILSVYQRIDKIVGEMLVQTDDNTYVLVVSDHGTDPVHKYFHLNSFLQSNGLLRQTTSPFGSAIQKVAGQVSASNARWFLGLLRMVMTPFQKVWSVGPSRSNADWAHTSVYVTGYGQVRINMKGREPAGIVEPGAQYENLRKLVIDKLKQVRDPENGKQIIDHVYTKEELFSGPHLAEAPDLMVHAPRGYMVVPWKSVDNKLVSRSVWSGKHSTRGLLAIKGPGVHKGKVCEASVVDVAPTILYVMGMPIPADMDGNVIDAFTEPYKKSNPLTKSEVQGISISREQRLSQEEEEQVSERLKALGYMG